MEKLIEQNFSRHAGSYDKYATVQLRVAHDLLGSFSLHGLKAILELGCGTGNYTLLLADKFKEASIVALDISQAMLIQARKKITGHHIEFIQADAAEFRTQQHFDLITSNACLQWVGDLNLILSNYRRMLKPGGTITFSTFGSRTFCELDQAISLFSGKRTIPAAGFLPQERLKGILKELFTTVKIRPVVYRETFTGLNEFLKVIKYSGTRGFGLGEKAALTRSDLKQIEMLYLRQFGKIVVTYEVFLCQAKD